MVRGEERGESVRRHGGDGGHRGDPPSDGSQCAESRVDFRKAVDASTSNPLGVPQSEPRDDLVHWNEANGHARLVELKWDSDGPRDAIRQILRYGAAYLFCRMHSDSLPVGRRAVMETREISLQVAAPARYYMESGLRDDWPPCAPRAVTAATTGGFLRLPSSPPSSAGRVARGRRGANRT